MSAMYLHNKYTTWYNNIITRAQSRSITGYVEKHHIIPKCMGGSDDKENLVRLTAREHFICHRLLVKMVSDSSYKAKLAYASWQQTRGAKNKGLRITSRTYDILRKQLSEAYTGRKRAPFSDATKANMKAGAANRKPVVFSPERLAKISELGKSFKGKPLSKEHKKKISNTNKGRTLSAEHKEKIGASKVGKLRPPFNEEWRRNMSEANRPQRGPATEETKKRISEKNKGRPSCFKGIPRSEEVRLKISQSRLLAPVKTCPHCGLSGKGGNMVRYHFDNCRLRS